MNRVAKSFSLIRKINLLQNSNARLLNTTSVVRGGDSHHSDHHKKEHDSSNHNVKTNKVSGFRALFEPNIHQKRGYIYREYGNMDGNLHEFLGKTLMTLLWFWIFYNFMVRPEDYFGHFPYPNTSEWTDEELGIKDE